MKIWNHKLANYYKESYTRPGGGGEGGKMRDPGNEVGYNTRPPGVHFFVTIMSVFLFIRIQKIVDIA